MSTEEEKRSGTELYWDRLLKIKTTGRDDSRSDHFHYPYEPTPYPVLQRLANSGFLRRKNFLVDYGCGKARVGLFLANQTRCRSVGVEYDERIYQTALENVSRSVAGRFVTLVNCPAERYEVPEEADRFYFFNPFSAETLHRVLSRIFDSFAAAPRELLLFFYYPSPEYRAELENWPGLALKEEIPCADLFSGDDAREVILIYQLVDDVVR